MTVKVKPQGWDQLSRREKLAVVMYPNLVKDLQLINEIKSISKGEGRIDLFTARGGGDGEGQRTNWLAPTNAAPKTSGERTSGGPSQYMIGLP